jgi:hypothetical protein
MDRQTKKVLSLILMVHGITSENDYRLTTGRYLY